MQTGERIHLPGLNALRFYAAISVVIAHTSNGFGELRTRPAHYPWLNALAMDAQSAVSLFFVLSGFLITYLLLEEAGRAGDISVRNFYIRRVLRIWPLYYLVAVGGLILFPFFLSAQSGLSHLNAGQIFLVLIFLPNFVTPLGPLGHLWSIGLEEQFYLAWPWIVRRQDKLVRFVVGVILVKLMVAPAVWLMADNSITNLFVGLRFESMAVGALGAYAFHNHHQIVAKLCSPLAKGVTLLGIVFVALVDIPLNELTILATSTLFIVLILNLVTDTRLHPLLENRWFTALGQASYGIYMYHFPLLFIALTVLGRVEITTGTGYDLLLYGVTIFGTLLLAFLSYRFYETPFLKLKERFSVIRTAR